MTLVFAFITVASAFVTGDELLDDEVVPFSMNLIVDFKGEKRKVCTAILLNRSWAITAAHCIEDDKRVKYTTHEISNEERNLFLKEVDAVYKKYLKKLPGFKYKPLKIEGNDGSAISDFRVAIREAREKLGHRVFSKLPLKTRKNSRVFKLVYEERNSPPNRPRNEISYAEIYNLDRHTGIWGFRKPLQVKIETSNPYVASRITLKNSKKKSVIKVEEVIYSFEGPPVKNPVAQMMGAFGRKYYDSYRGRDIALLKLRPSRYKPKRYARALSRKGCEQRKNYGRVQTTILGRSWFYNLAEESNLQKRASDIHTEIQEILSKSGLRHLQNWDYEWKKGPGRYTSHKNVHMVEALKSWNIMAKSKISPPVGFFEDLVREGDWKMEKQLKSSMLKRYGLPPYPDDWDYAHNAEENQVLWYLKRMLRNIDNIDRILLHTGSKAKRRWTNLKRKVLSKLQELKDKLNWEGKATGSVPVVVNGFPGSDLHKRRKDDVKNDLVHIWAGKGKRPVNSGDSGGGMLLGALKEIKGRAKRKENEIVLGINALATSTSEIDDQFTDLCYEKNLQLLEKYGLATELLEAEESEEGNSESSAI